MFHLHHIFFSLVGKSRALLPDGAWPAALSGADHNQPNDAENNTDARGAHDQPSVPRPEPEAHRRPPPVYLLAGAVSHFRLSLCRCDLVKAPRAGRRPHFFLMSRLRGLPDSKSNLLRFIQEVHGHYLHQRPLHTPVVVHCR